MVKKYILSGDDFSLAGGASSDLKSVLKRLGVSPEAVRRVSVAMYEAEINTIIHGGGGECEADITAEAITLVFTDNGPGIADIELAMQEGFSTASDEVREMGFGAGMGLPNMKKYTDKMEIRTEPGKGTRLELVVNL